MKLVFFDDFKLGVVKDGNVVDVGAAVSGINHTSPQDLINQIIANFSQHRAALQGAADSGQGTPVDQVRLRSPLPKPGNIVAMAVNYMEDGTRDEPAPINAFHKSPNAVIGQGDTMVLPDVPATIFEGEAEMALVISKHASNVSQEDAFDYIFWLPETSSDGSARGLPPAGNTFYQMKSRDTFCAHGSLAGDRRRDRRPPKLAGAAVGQRGPEAELQHQRHGAPDPQDYRVGKLCPMTWKPGDVIATGTNHRGLSAFQDGDKIDLEVEGMGMLRFNIQDDLKRTWARTTRLEMMEQGKEGTTPQISGKIRPKPIYSGPTDGGGESNPGRHRRRPSPKRLFQEVNVPRPPPYRSMGPQHPPSTSTTAADSSW